MISVIVEGAQRNNLSNRLSNFDIAFIKREFEKQFLQAKFTNTESYVFGKNLLNHCDVMVDNNYTLKTLKNQQLVDSLLALHETSLKDKFDLVVKSDHKTYNYIELIPKNSYLITELGMVYIKLTKEISMHLKGFTIS